MLVTVLGVVADALPAGSPGIHPAVEAAAGRLEAEPGREWSVAELGREVGMHPAGLARRFSEELGEPPMARLRALRLEAAATALRETARPIGEIGAAVGYPDANLFARRFRARYGATPTAWRAEARAR